MTPYTLTPAPLREIRLTIPLLDPDGFESRGALLARAVRGRYAREGQCFYMTPARAHKWETLYLEGFRAKVADCKCGYRFVHPAMPRRSMHLRDANCAARLMQIARAPAAPAPLPTMEVA